MRVLIIGPGRLGGMIASEALAEQRVEEVFLVGRDREKTSAVAIDLADAFPTKTIHAGSVEEAQGTFDYSFFSFSTLQWRRSIGPNDRILEAPTNMAIFRNIQRSLRSLRLGTIVVISNPVDILTRYIAETLETPSQVFGFGISLDELRIATALRQLSAYDGTRVRCVGEHGAHVVPLLSTLREISTPTRRLYSDALRIAFSRTASIIQHVGIPLYGPAREFGTFFAALVGKGNSIYSMSAYLEREYEGVQGIATGVGVSISRGSIAVTERPPFSDYEHYLFQKSAAALRAQYATAIRARS
jgi:malate/lactate dehydrogenase